jgi:hypothetical protein
MMEFQFRRPYFRLSHLLLLSVRPGGRGGAGANSANMSDVVSKVYSNQFHKKIITNWNHVILYRLLPQPTL